MSHEHRWELGDSVPMSLKCACGVVEPVAAGNVFAAILAMGLVVTLEVEGVEVVLKDRGEN